MSKTKLRKKSFILTLDAILAALALTLLITIVMFNISSEHTYSFGNYDLDAIGKDTLAVLEKDNSIQKIL